MTNNMLYLAPICSFLLGRIAVRLVRRVALAAGFVDNPDRRRKLQETPIPLGGGIAVWAAAWLGWGICWLGRSWETGGLGDGAWFYLSLAIASFLTLVVGVVDDRRGLRGGHKLAGQVAAAAILVVLGTRIDALGGFGYSVELGRLAYPVTVFWIILVINAFNLIDGMDGFCGGVGLVACLAIAFLSYASGRVGDALIALAIAGALAAFLRDNLPPARVYLGDAGSMSLGMMISALSIRACSEGPGSPVSVAPLIALLTLPLLDVATALGRRWLTGHSLFMPDRGHIHHRLRNRLGGTAPALAVGVGLAVCGACGAALAKARGLGDGLAVVAVIAPVALLVGTRTFGGSELRLLAYRVRSTAARYLSGGRLRQAAIRHECRLLGVRDWARVWDTLIRAVEAAGMRSVELAIEMPAAGETYHGLWTVPKASEDRPAWSVVHTLHVGGIHAGTLRVAGNIEPARNRYLDRVEEIVRSLEGQLEEELARVPEGRFAADAPPTRFGVVG